ncbi:MAG: DUF5677 domain-containing protein [Planctomycetota bacterium]|jgi:hypothetical protein
MRPYEWKSKLPELLLIVGLLEEQSVKDVVAVLSSLRESVPAACAEEKASGFGGTVSEVAELARTASEQNHGGLMPILRSIYREPNISLLKIFELPGKNFVCELLGPFGAVKQEDYLRVMGTTGAASHGQSGRATRAKLVQLMLWDPDGSKTHIEFDKLGRLLEGKGDDVYKEQGCSIIRATWGAMQGCSDEEAVPWVETFWQFSLNNTPCLREDKKKGRDRICISGELRRSIKKIDRLWNTVVRADVKHDLLFVSDVVMGLACRTWRFMHHILETSGAGNGEMAEIAARCQWDSVVTLEWLLDRDDPELFLQYRTYSAGKTKATLERLRAETEAYGGEKLRAKIEPTLIREVQEGAGIWEQLVNEERGGWAKETTYDMAKEMSKLPEYEIYFRRLSDIVHGTWRALDRYHVRRCLNPLHGEHYVAWTGATHDAGETVVHFGVKMAVRAFKALLQHMGPEARPNWKERLQTIESEVLVLAKEHFAQFTS